MDLNSKDKEIQLNDFRETGLMLRHFNDQTVRWGALFITFTITFLSLSVVYFPNIPFWSFIGIGCFSIFAVWVTLVIVERFDTDGEWVDPGDVGMELGIMIINARISD